MTQEAKDSPVDAPPADGFDGANGEAGPSKKALKKAEAKAKKEAEKLKRAAERAAQQVAVGTGATPDFAQGLYGKMTAESMDALRCGTVLSVPLKKLGEKHFGKEILVRGWVQNSRAQGAKMVFFEIREEGPDWVIQGLVVQSVEDSPKPVSRQFVKWANSVTLESYVVVRGIVSKPLEPVKSCRVSNYEIHISNMYLLSPAPQMLGMTLASSGKPITNFADEDHEKAAEGPEISEQSGVPAATMLTHLDEIVIHKRAPVQQAIADIRMTTKNLFREYLSSQGFKEFEAPCLIGAASEGGSNVFGFKYFEKEAFLAQSPQFYKQIEIAGGRQRVYCIGPVFRAENSNTPRHMTEFTGLDMEMTIVEDYHEVLHMLEGCLLHIFRCLKERCSYEIELVRSVYPSEEFKLPVPGQEVRLTFAEGQKLLREEGPEEYRNVSDNEDMSTAQEKALGALIRAKYDTDFYVLDKFPEGARPFYAKVDPKQPKLTNAYDFFMRGQEILSGGQRIENPDELEARIIQKGIDPKSPGIKEYVDIFRQAGVPAHGGGGASVSL